MVFNVYMESDFTWNSVMGIENLIDFWGIETKSKSVFGAQGTIDEKVIKIALLFSKGE